MGTVWIDVACQARRVANGNDAAVADTVQAFLQGVSVAASPVLATIGMSVRLSVCPSVRHTLALSENDAS